MEIVKCKKKLGQLVIPIFYGVAPSHVRKQTGKFGEAFAKTCQSKTENETKLWRQSLTDVANILGYHSQTWPSEAKMIEAIANDILSKLNITPPKDFEDFVGIEDHIAVMSVLLDLESRKVRMLGIWGTSGIGKTTIARALYSRLSHRFQANVFIDRAFVSRSTDIYKNSNPDDYNKKLHLVRSFLSEVLDKKDIRIDCLGAMEGRLKNKKVLIFIDDDLDDQMVLDTLAGQTHWFGCGSRIIVVTKDKHLLRAHEIDYIYNVSLPSKDLALEMLCISAFKKNIPPEDMRELASEVAFLAGNLPLGLKVLGSSLRGRDKDDWMDMLPRLRNSLDGKIEKTLRVSYDGLNNRKDQAIFRHIACLFNGEKLNDIKLLLADSDLDVNIGLKNLVDKSLIHVRYDYVEMHRLLEEMGKEIVHAQSNESGEREFLVDSKDICDMFEDNTGTKRVLGISLNMDEIDDMYIHENVFKGMRNLFFLKLYTKKPDKKKQVIWHLPEGFDYLPSKLKLLRFDGYPMKHMPSNFRPENLVKLQMEGSKLEKLWDGIHILKRLEEINLSGSKNLKEIPDLSMATNLKKLSLEDCSNLIELPFSIQYLNKLEKLLMKGCTNVGTLPTGINLQSLQTLDLRKCSMLKSFPDISTNISFLLLSKSWIEEFSSNLRLENLCFLSIQKMKNEKLWESVQILKRLEEINLSGSKNLKEIPDLSMATNLRILNLEDCSTLVELPSSIQYLNKLEELLMEGCTNVETLPTGINLQSLQTLDLRKCSMLKSFPDISTNISVLLSKTWIEEFSSILRLENLLILKIWKMKSEKFWDRVQPLKPLMTMMSPTLERLFLSDIPSLVELPSSIQKFRKLNHLHINDCINLETLPHGINFPFLYSLEISGCPRMKTFPDISTNINQLYLQQTGIEEVPWWIEKFSKLSYLTMKKCNNLRLVSLNIYKLHLEVDFSDCKALTEEASWNGSESEVAMALENIHSTLPGFDEVSSCYRRRVFIYRFLNLDPEAILINRSIIFTSMQLTSEEVPSYFTHQTTGNSLTNIHLHQSSLAQSFLRLKVGAVILSNSKPKPYNCIQIHLSFRFKSKFGNSFDSLRQLYQFWNTENDKNLCILDCRIPLSKDNAPLPQLSYDHVDIRIYIEKYTSTYTAEDDTKFTLKGWGIRLLEDC